MNRKNNVILVIVLLVFAGVFIYFQNGKQQSLAEKSVDVEGKLVDTIGEPISQGTTINGYKVVSLTSFSQNKLPKILKTAFNTTATTKLKKYIVYNNGNPLQTDYFVKGKNEGNNVIAITYVKKGELYVKTVHITNKNHIDKAELINILQRNDANNISVVNDFVIQEADKNTDNIPLIVENYHWHFYEKGFKSFLLAVELCTDVQLKRQTNEALVNNEKGSIWNVSTTSRYSKGKAIRLDAQKTKLSVAKQNQSLIGYQLMRRYELKNFTITDLSSLPGKYGAWEFRDKLGNEPLFVTRPAIRATNTDGKFAVELSHTLFYKVGVEQCRKAKTGVIQILTDDR